MTTPITPDSISKLVEDVATAMVNCGIYPTHGQIAMSKRQYLTWAKAAVETIEAQLLRQQSSRIAELEEALRRRDEALSGARAQAKRKGRDLLREEADAVLPCFRADWEQLSIIARRTNKYSPQQLASRARDLRKRGLVEQRWNDGVMRICEWRTTLSKAPNNG